MHSKMNLDTAIGGSLYIVRIFSSSELVEPPINPFKVRLAVALKEELINKLNDRYLTIARDCAH